MKRFFFLYFDKFLTLKYSLKTKLFRSSLGELSSIMYLIHHINAKNLFFFRKKRVLRSKKAIELKERGFTTFSNKSIEKTSLIMLEKIRSIKDQWGIHNDINFDFNPTSKFQNELIQIFESGIDEFIKSVYKSDYSIFYHKIYKSKRDSKEQLPENSQLWHADGYPGTGINLMICHTPISKNNGSMKIINWKKSRELLNKLFFDYKQFLRYKNYLDPINKKNKSEYRKVRCQLLKDYIDQESIKYFQPESEKSGTIFAFSNNCVHAGGYTEVGYERIVSLFNIYPSTKNTTLKEKFDFCMRNDYSFPKINEIFKI